MKKTENYSPKEVLDNSLKLLVLEEVEKEVEKRIKRQEWFYWKFLFGFFLSVTAFAWAFWHVEMSKIPSEVEKQLAEKEIMKTKERILETQSVVEKANQNINIASGIASNALNSLLAEQHAFTNRLNEIRGQDNILLDTDFQRFFVHQTVTNFDGKKLWLDYEPIQETLQFDGDSTSFRLTRQQGCHLEGKAIVCDDEDLRRELSEMIPHGELKARYARKFIH